MKKSLLLAMSVVTALSVSAQALKTVKVVNDVDATPASSVMDVATVVEKSAPQLKAAPVAAPQNAEGDDFTPVPFYTVNGMFYDGYTLDVNDPEAAGNFYLLNGQYGYLPCFTDITYTSQSSYEGTLPGNFVLSWTYPEYSEVDLEAESVRYYERTAEGDEFTAGFKTKYVPFPINLPVTLDFDGTTYAVGNTFTSGGTTYSAQGFQYGGPRVWNTTQFEGNYNVLLHTYPMVSRASSYTSLTGNYDVYNSLRVSNWILGKPYYNDLETPLKVGILLNPGDNGAVYGFEHAVLRTYVESLAAGGEFTLDIYEVIENQDAEYWEEVYTCGKLLASGHVATDAYTATGGQLVAIPVLKVEGEGEDKVETPTFFNVDRPVMLVVGLKSADGADDTVMPIPVFTSPNASSVLRSLGNAFAVLDGYANVPTWPSVKSIGGYKMYQITWDFGFDLQYSYLHNDGSAPEYSYDAPAEGGSKTFDFTPLIDLYDAETTTTNGEEWAFAYADEELQADGSQKLIVEVDPLPAGVAGRSTVMTVAIKGAQQTITVRQGDTSGIDSVNGDAAEVVSSQIFDLQGRQLNVVPESGLYIRRDVKADNTVSTVKVVK